MLWQELSFWFHLQTILINHIINILYMSFKQWNMENVMDFHWWRKSKHVCHWPYPFKDLKWSTISRWQLGTWSYIQGDLLGIDTQVHMLSNLKLLEHSMLILISLLLFLCFLQIPFDKLYLLLHLSQHIRANQHPANWITPTNRIIKTPPIERLKWTHLQGFLVPIIIRKLHSWKILWLTSFFDAWHTSSIYP